MLPCPSEDLDHVVDRTADVVWEGLRNQSVFLTGGSGFVGTWLTESFIRANERRSLGATLTVLTRDPDLYRAKAPHVFESRSIRVAGGDMSSFKDPEGEFAFVIHAATARYFEPSQEFPSSTFNHDVAGTRRVLGFARRHGTRRFLFTSSGAVYGKQPPELTHIPEDYAGAPSTTDAASAYGQAKRVSEWLSVMYARQYGFEAAIARLFAFVGPHLPLDANYAVGNFIRDAMRGGPVRISGDGTPYRSYLYAADLAVWLWTILVQGPPGCVYNVGSADAISIARLATAVVDAIAPGTPVDIAQQPVPGTPAPRYVPSIDRAHRDLGLRPLIALDEGVRRTYSWHLRLGRSGAGR